MPSSAAALIRRLHISSPRSAMWAGGSLGDRRQRASSAAGLERTATSLLPLWLQHGCVAQTGRLPEKEAVLTAHLCRRSSNDRGRANTPTAWHACSTGVFFPWPPSSLRPFPPALTRAYAPPLAMCRNAVGRWFDLGRVHLTSFIASVNPVWNMYDRVINDSTLCFGRGVSASPPPTFFPSSATLMLAFHPPDHPSDSGLMTLAYTKKEDASLMAVFNKMRKMRQVRADATCSSHGRNQREFCDHSRLPLPPP